MRKPFETVSNDGIDPFRGPKSKVTRARHHAADHYDAIRRMDGTDFTSYRVVPDLADPTKAQLVTGKRSEIPDLINLSAADALYNLRSALDQAAARCAAIAGRATKNTYFPHGKDRSSFEKSLRKKCGDVPPRARDVIRMFQPYHRGEGNLIRTLHELNLVDKHNDIITLNMVVGEVAFSGKVFPGLPLGEVVGRDVPEDRLAKYYVRNGDDDIKIATMIAFGGQAEIANEPTCIILDRMCDLVSAVIAALEATV